MIYVMSDIHGHYDKYQAMLEKIAFNDADTLYVLGDVLDRGPDGFQILLDIAKRDNVVFMYGNHDVQAAILLSNMNQLKEKNMMDTIVSTINLWFNDGGYPTLKAFMDLPADQQKIAIDLIKNAPAAKEITVGEQNFLLAHTVPDFEQLEQYENWSMDEFITGKPSYDKVYFDDMIIVTGHTPTEYIDSEYKGKVWMKNQHLAIDCGTGFGGPLGCVCLDTMETYYV